MKRIKKTDSFEYYVTDSGADLVRFNSLNDILEYDYEKEGIGWRDQEYAAKDYFKRRRLLSKKKLELINTARKQLQIDKDFLKLIYKAKTAKKSYQKNRFGGNLSMPAYVTNSKDLFLKRKPGSKKATIDMAFQVGTLSGGSYSGGFVNILKAILMAQALGINLNIDMFDSDTSATNNSSYIITRVADSRKVLNMPDILLCSDRRFFDFTLFNGYSACGKIGHIGTFLSSGRIERDLGPMYDVIGGNMLSEEAEGGMVSQILKISGLS